MSKAFSNDKKIISENKCSDNKEKKNISVALAYYQGGSYIREQLNSILKQLGAQDEVIISVDSAEDGSMGLLRSYAQGDSRIHLIRGPGKGVVKNFEHAIKRCRGEIIFLSDQDDIWADDKVEKVMEAFRNPELICLVHDARIVNSQGDISEDYTMFDWRKSGPGLAKNFVRNSYVGCCMAFRRKLVRTICPIPKAMYMHDFWIGMAAEMSGEVLFLPECLLFYRRHDDNITEMRHGSISFMIKKRANIIRCLRLLQRRVTEEELR